LTVPPASWSVFRFGSASERSNCSRSTWFRCCAGPR